jgi:hypothetical protein
MVSVSLPRDLPLQRSPKVTSLVARFSICVGFVDVTPIQRESGAYVTQMLHAEFAYDVRHVARVSFKCCAHLPPREERTTRDLTFEPICMGIKQQISSIILDFNCLDFMALQNALFLVFRAGGLKSPSTLPT